MDAPRSLRIGELAALLGTTTKTLRFYEQIGLLEPVKRSGTAYRVYDDPAVETARLVIGLRHLQLTIPELQQLVHDSQGTRRQRLLAIIDERLRRMELELGVLQGRCDDLAARHLALLATPRERPPDCVCDALLRPCTCAAKST
ncbi:MAG TPA: MerR family transcriptional regulator [Burkholderiaceae bacterium]|nr:MerR family transcriptional regulator [Burkholderiaceae bacterium]